MDVGILPGSLEFRLLNEFQRGLPLVPQPFAAMGGALGESEARVLGVLARLSAEGTVSRVGVVFRPNAAGASTLAAMAVPEQHIERIAAQVSAHLEVNHNYEREHRYNLWFVATAPAQEALNTALASIERETSLPVLSLPLVEEYHIDLGFDLTGRADKSRKGRNVVTAGLLEPRERTLVQALQRGLRLVARPFEVAGALAGMPEAEVIDTLDRWLEEGIARRIGVVVRHRPLGYESNAMVVWDVPDGDVATMGARLARWPEVTLCYRRPRKLPVWRYNLFCMLHGRAREQVLVALELMRAANGLVPFPMEVLLSRRCFKQRGALYAREAARG